MFKGKTFEQENTVALRNDVGHLTQNLNASRKREAEKDEELREANAIIAALQEECDRERTLRMREESRADRTDCALKVTRTAQRKVLSEDEKDTEEGEYL